MKQLVVDDVDDGIAEGKLNGFSDGIDVGYNKGIADGITVGKRWILRRTSLLTIVGDSDNVTVGSIDGSTLGLTLGLTLDSTEGLALGILDGIDESNLEGIVEGMTGGLSDELSLLAVVGDSEITSVGIDDGSPWGTLDGISLKV